MIHYILGRAGSGKTSYCLGKFQVLESGVFFVALRDEKDFENLKASQLSDLGETIFNKCIINILPPYRANLDDIKNFHKMMNNAVKETIASKQQSIFFDEFQLYFNDELIELILNSDKDFYIIHQFPKQLENKYFTVLWEKAEKKYLLDPYEPSEFYKL